MKLAKPEEQDFITTREFLQLCEALWDSRQRFSLRPEEKQWMSWDNDDPDRRECVRIRRMIAEDLELPERYVDDRLIIYELLRQKYKKCDTNWGRVIMTARVLLENVCDPTLDYVEFYPGFECLHVAPEQ